MFKRITNLPEFDRDMKKLRKRFSTLPDALDVFINTPLKLFHRMELNTADIRRIADLGIQEPKIYKARKIPCRDLKGRGSRTGLRIVYAYFASANRIEFIEIYFKADRANHNEKRILNHYKKG